MKLHSAEIMSLFLFVIFLYVYMMVFCDIPE